MWIIGDVSRIVSNWILYVRTKSSRYLDEMIQFASDVSRSDSVVASRLKALQEEHGTTPPRSQTRTTSSFQLSFEFAVTDILFDAGWALLLVWKERADAAISAADTLLHRITGNGLDFERLRAMRATVAKASGGKALKTEIDLIYGPLCDELKHFNLRVLDINRGGDDYAFVIVTPENYHRWVDIFVSQNFVIEYPGWQFARALKGTRYERFTRERRLRRLERVAP